MQIIDLFSGFGGFSVAGEWIGWETIQFCEIDKNCQNLLSVLFPNVPIHDDIKTLDCEKIKSNPESTILVGGFPCQPFSAAGKQKGTDDERHLWPYMLNAIRKLHPCWVVGENVRGLVNWSDGLVFDQVQTDLENEGYEVIPFLLPACGVNAPHRRDRIWFVAYSNAAGQRGNERKSEIESNVISNAKCERLQKSEASEQRKPLFDAERNDLQNVTNAPRFGMEGSGAIGEQKPSIQTGERLSGCDNPGTDWKDFPTQSPVCGRNDGFPTESLRAFIREDSNGNLSEEEIDKIFSAAYSKWRNITIKGYGNAIVPQVAFQIFKAIRDYETRNTRR